jgi:ketopantoate reductase
MNPLNRGAATLARRHSTGSIDPAILQSLRAQAQGLGVRRTSLTSFSGARLLSSKAPGPVLSAKPAAEQGSAPAAAADGKKPVDRLDHLYPMKAKAKPGDRPIAILSATGGLSAGAEVALLSKKRAGKNAPEITLFSRQDPRKLEAAGGLRVEASITGRDGKREFFQICRREFPSVQWAHNEQVKDIADGSIVIEGGSALHLEEQIKPLGGHKGLDILTMANGLNHRQRLEKLGDGLSVSPGQAWFNGKDHPDGKGGKFVSSGGHMDVNPRSEAFRDEISGLWNNDVVELRLLPPAEARAAEINKAVANACLNPLGIIFGKKMRAMDQTPGVQQLMHAITAECSSIVKLGGEDVESAEQLFKRAQGLALGVTKQKDFHTSSYAPFALGQRTELEFVNGEFARMAESLGGRAPLNEALNAMVKEMTADRAKFPSDEAFRADLGQQAKQAERVTALFRLAGVPHDEAATLAAKALAGPKEINIEQ